MRNKNAVYTEGLTEFWKERQIVLPQIKNPAINW